MDKGAATIVEVQTLGEQGLKYRHRFGRSWSEWINVGAVPAPRLADTCGSGDWCTAGLIAKVAAGGVVGLHDVGADGLRAALRVPRSHLLPGTAASKAHGRGCMLSPETPLTLRLPP